MPSFAERVFDGLADLQRGAQHAGAGADQQGAIVGIEAARKRHEALCLGKRLRPPNRRCAIGARRDPNLQSERIERRRHLARWRATISPQM